MSIRTTILLITFAVGSALGYEPREPAIGSAKLDGLGDERVLDSSTDINGNTYVVGYFESDFIEIDTFADLSGDEAGEVASTQSAPERLANQGGQDLFVAKFSPSGRLLWANAGGGGGDDIATGVGVDTDGNVFITGEFQGTAFIGGTTINSGLQSSDGPGQVTADSSYRMERELFVAMISSDGRWRWAKRLEYNLSNRSVDYSRERYVNFATTDVTATPNYDLDHGDTYTAGRGYGWDRDIRNETDDDRGGLDEFIHTRGAEWRVDVPAGTYRVRIQSWDPENNDSYYNTVLETSANGFGVLIRRNVDALGITDPVTGTVSSTTLPNAGFLRLREGSSAMNNKISWVEIDRANFGPASAEIRGVFEHRSAGDRFRSKALTLDGDGNVYIKGLFGAVGDTSGGGTLFFETGAGSEFELPPEMDDVGFVARLQTSSIIANRNDPTSWEWDWLQPMSTDDDTSHGIADLASDGEGGIVVVGSWQGDLFGDASGSRRKGFLVRLNASNGIASRVSRIDSSPSATNGIEDVADFTIESVEVDDLGNAIVVGNFVDRPDEEGFAEERRRRRGVTFSPTGGTALPELRSDSQGGYFVAKADFSGNWVSAVKGSPNDPPHFATDLAIDAGSNVYVTGYSRVDSIPSRYVRLTVTEFRGLFGNASPGLPPTFLPFSLGELGVITLQGEEKTPISVSRDGVSIPALSDDDPSTDFQFSLFTGASVSPVEFVMEFSEPVTANGVVGYTGGETNVTDPIQWRLEGSNDGVNWQVFYESLEDQPVPEERAAAFTSVINDARSRSLPSRPFVQKIEQQDGVFVPGSTLRTESSGSFHGASLSASPTGTLNWVVTSGFDSGLGADHPTSNWIHGTRGFAADQVNGSGSLMFSVDLDLSASAPPNETGYYAGQEIPVPAGAYREPSGLPAQPDITIGGQINVGSEDFFLWDEFAGRLLVVSPIASAEIGWRVSGDLQDQARITQTVSTRWPTPSDGAETFQSHQVGDSPTSANLVPAVDLQYGTGSHRFANLLFTSASATLSGTELSAGAEGWTSLLYIEGESGVPGQAASVIVPVNHVRYRNNLAPPTPADIGAELTDPAHADPVGNGFVFNELAPIDSALPDSAYDSSLRSGPILPVNRDDPTTEFDDLVVAWYSTHPTTGIYWPSRAVHYEPRWPADAERIVITSSLGSDVVIDTPAGFVFPNEQLVAPEFTNTQIYHQPDRELGGYNPNEEHALIRPSQTREGASVFALRNDLNHIDPNGNRPTSDPYVLMKYQDGTNGGRSAMKVYKVELTGSYTVGPDSVDFDFSSFGGLAGRKVLPPYPLSTLGSTEETVGTGTPYWQDRTGAVWARAAGQMTVGYFYPNLPEFWYDLDGDGADDGLSVVPWLQFVKAPDAPPANATPDDQPINISYNIEWPPNVPTLQVGETLSRATGGLPDLRNWQSSEIVFDENVPQVGHIDPAVAALANPLDLTARLLDATTPRRVEFPVTNLGTQLSNAGGLPLAIEFADNGRFFLSDLPPHLKPRVKYDPAAFSFQGALTFEGIDENDPTGAAPVLINVMTDREREQMKAIDDPDSGPTTGSDWDRAVDKLYTLTRNPNGLQVNGLPADALLYGLVASEGKLPPYEPADLQIENILAGTALTAGVGNAVGYMTLAQNNDPSLDGDPITLEVIRVVNPPFVGHVNVINPDNVFSEKVALKHSGDFGGNPDGLEFEWYYKEDEGGPAPSTLPTNDATWTLIASGTGTNDHVFLGDGIRVLSDGWVYVRYRGYDAGVHDPMEWGEFAGDRSATTEPRPAHIDGWIKRVLFGINAFDQRTNNFHDSPAQTYVSMIQQAGPRYEGPVAFNPDAANVNSLGLIALYQTVLRTGLNLSINGVNGQTSPGVNNALLLAASRISDFYMLLGNEAYGDAQDPTIGFNTAGGPDFGTLTSSVFSFQNQLPSLIDEELALLRGRDDSGAGVGAAPVYNRLFWNFTNGLEGEPAYTLNYNITDQDFDGFINETDAATLYPQGHGDAWGHYLCATKIYYQLMRHPAYTWLPRSETVSVAGVAINVDFLDEVKFARAAAAKAKAGKEIVDLTYRDRYVADPAGQWQGYTDTDRERAWGVDEWARRTGQAAVIDWALANAVLPEESSKTGLEMIDRTTVVELREIAAHFGDIQDELDQADKGLNPLGLRRDAVPFDINPSEVLPTASNTEPKTHFEQVFERANEAVANARGVFDFANQATERIRKVQFTAEEFADELDDGERDFRNRLIEIFGYPYEGDIGPGKVYPDPNYAGPDIYRWMYVDVAEYSEEALPEPTGSFEGFFGTVELQTGDAPGPSGNFDSLVGHFFPGDVSDLTHISDNDDGEDYKSIEYPVLEIDQRGNGSWPFQQAVGMGSRRAPGRVQLAIGSVIQADIELQKSLGEYNDYLDEVVDELQLLQAFFDTADQTITLLSKNRDVQVGLTSLIVALDTTALILREGQTAAYYIGETLAESLAQTTSTVGMSNSLGDIFAPGRGGLLGSSGIAATVFGLAAAATESTSIGIDAAKEGEELRTEIEIEKAGLSFEIAERVKLLEQLMRGEGDFRVAIYQRQLELETALGEFRAVLQEGNRLFEERLVFNRKVAGPIQALRYQDIAFRNFRNDALQKYRSSFDLAATYVFLAAKAYDFETNLLPSESNAGNAFLTDIVRQRSLGQFIGGTPVNGVNGLSDPMARMQQNFQVLKGQLGFNNPQVETGRFSMRKELFRLRDTSDDAWAQVLQDARVPDLFQIPEFRRYCRPFAPEQAGAQPGLVIPFKTDVTFGLNFFGFPLAGGDSSYDSSNFATKVRSVGVWFDNYNGTGLSVTPRVYLVPAGSDVMRSPVGSDLAVREFKVADQRLPVPFPIGSNDLSNPDWIPQNDTLGGGLSELRRFNRFRAYHDSGFDLGQMTRDSRLIGRSVWNTRWVLIIPGGTFLNDPNEGLDTFILGQPIPGTAQRDGNGIKDIKLFFETYAYSGL